MAATDTEILARLRLINTDGIGPVTFYKLLKTCRSAENALRSLPPKFHPAPLAAAEREISLARAKGIKILAFDNPEYPQKLRELEDAPPFLYVKGRTDILNRRRPFPSSARATLQLTAANWPPGLPMI